MTPRRELYEAEEKTLRVMLAEEEEEKEKERRENERKNQGTGQHSCLVCLLRSLVAYFFDFVMLVVKSIGLKTKKEKRKVRS